MKLIGHELVAYEPLFYCKIGKQITPGRHNLFNFNRFLIKQAQELSADFSVKTSDLNEVIVANAAGAKFIVVPRELAIKAAKLAQDYLFDAQICVIVSGEGELAELAKTGADAAIFKNAVIGKDKR